MSVIPNSAVTDAFIPVQRAAHESVRARHVQALKNNHHAEDVDELDDTAVNSVRDQKQHHGGEAGEERHERPQGERVEIEALAPAAPGETPEIAPADSGIAHLDISA